MNTVPIFRRVALIGFGLIGGSIARAARVQGLAGEIVTTARSEKTRARVKELGIVDRVVELVMSCDDLALPVESV